jgi:enoyl-CoA hydratase/carnithine racemase
VPDLVRLEADGAVGVIRLDRPPLNALNVAMQDQLRDVALRVADDTDIRAVVVYGGERAFAAGADVKEMAQLSHAEMARRAPILQASFDAVARIPQPVIAAITGYALGGGCELALAADFRVCADDATLGQPEIALGIIPGAGGTQRLPRLIGPARAKDLVFTGRLVKADEALAIGLVDAVVPADRVLAEATAMAQRLARGPAAALRAAKAAIDGGLDGDVASGLRLESHLFASLFATEDRVIGMRAFVEKSGDPPFVGR